MNEAWLRKIDNHGKFWSRFIDLFLKDRFADAQSCPPLDKENNYNLTGFEESEGKTVLRFSRKFDTCDPRDRKIEVILNIAYSFFCRQLSQNV